MMSIKQKWVNEYNTKGLFSDIAHYTTKKAGRTKPNDLILLTV
jgi:hypothetical protein